VAIGDWPEMRGPNRDGVSKETGLIDKWALNGENFLWRAPYGGRSAPIVMGNRVYLQNPSGRGAETQERVMALNVDTGRVIWEYKFNAFQSDVPPHRIGWASPAADPETGNIYALSGVAQVVALNRDGKLLWNRSFGEEFAAFTTQGGRTMSPLVDGDLVIVSSAVSNWGSAAMRAHRLIALDKRTGDVIYVANPGQRPYDTAYAAPLIATINGLRLLIAGLGDGGIHAIKPQTGERVWSFVAAKRAINTGVAVVGNDVFVSHGDENLEGNELGLIAAIDGAQTGDIKATKWAVRGVEFGYSSPVTDGTRLYQIDNGSQLVAFDTQTGKQLWSQSLGILQKAPPVLADGKIYVTNEDGVTTVVRSGPVFEVLAENALNDYCLSSPAISDGQIFLRTANTLFCIGKR
jgi:outer membrane protein assembly factor BamB